MEERQKRVKKQIQERHKKVEKQRKNIAGMVTISAVVACMIASLLLQRKEINDSIKSYSARYEMLQDSIEEEKEHVKEIEKLKEIIADVLNVEVNDITEDTTFVDDLGADSLDIFQIIMGIEETFDIEIDNDDAEQISTVGDAVEQIKNATNNN